MTTRIYLASPYTSGISPTTTARIRASIMGKRCSRAEKAAALLIKDNYAVYSPIASWHHVALKHRLPKGDDFWRRQNAAMLDWCHVLVVLKITGWNHSYGIDWEVRAAMNLDKHIQYMTMLSPSQRKPGDKPYYLTGDTSYESSAA